jgi:arsenate reductase
MTAAKPARPTVLFVCVHNAGRSQMAAGWLRHLAGDRIEVRSAGSVPADAVNPVAVEAMAEVGIDIAAEQPKTLTPDAVAASDVVVTMGCGDACPFYPGKRYEDWDLEDPGRQGHRGGATSPRRGPGARQGAGREPQRRQLTRPRTRGIAHAGSVRRGPPSTVGPDAAKGSRQAVGLRSSHSRSHLISRALDICSPYGSPERRSTSSRRLLWCLRTSRASS